MNPTTIRRNAGGDDPIRALERRWRAGDPAAGQRLGVELARRGALTLDWIVQLGPLAREAIQALPFEIAEAAAFALTMSRGGLSGAKARLLVHEDDFNWFPAHRQVDVCPRGHALDPDRQPTGWAADSLQFAYSPITGITSQRGRPVLQADQQTLYDVDDPTEQPDGHPLPFFGVRLPGPAVAHLVCEAPLGEHLQHEPSWRRDEMNGLWYPTDQNGNMIRYCMARWRVPIGSVSWG